MTEIEDMLLELAWKNYDLCFSSKVELENKTNIILVADGVLLGLIFTGFQYLFSALGYLTIIILLFSSFFCVLVLRLEKYDTINTMKTWHALKERQILDQPIKAKKNLMATIDKAVTKNWDAYDGLLKHYKISLVFFEAGLIILSISILIPAIGKIIGGLSPS